jgi:hypothetical protein
MLRRLLGSRLALSLEQGECVIVPQTRGYLALHADVRLSLTARRPCTLSDASLVWGDGRRTLRRSRWDRAVIEGRFRYPPEPLLLAVDDSLLEVTLTFTDALIPRPAGPPPPTSTLVLELAVLGQGRPITRLLWRISLASWDEPASAHWSAA